MARHSPTQHLDPRLPETPALRGPGTYTPATAGWRGGRDGGGRQDGGAGFWSSTSLHKKAAGGNVHPIDLLNVAQVANQVQLGP